MRSRFTLMLVFLPLLASAATHRVPEDFTTIQEGIDACAAGDTVLIAAGTYMGTGNRNLQVEESIVILGSGREQTVIDCEHEEQGVLILCHAGMIAELTIRRAGPTAAVTLNNSDGYMIEDIAILESSVYGLKVGESRGFSIRNSLIADAGYSGIQLTELNLGTNEAHRVTIVRSGESAVSVGWGVLHVSNCVFAYTGGVALYENWDPDFGCLGCFDVDDCLLYGNRAGDSIREDTQGGWSFISSRPMFCDVHDADFHLHSTSPCFPENNEFGVMLGGTDLGCSDPIFTVSGTVLNQHGQPVADVTVDSGYVLEPTDDNGRYTFPFIAGASETLIPSHHHCDGFSPESIIFENLQMDLVGQDFIAQMRDSVIDVPGEVPTLKAGLNIALPGDTIRLAPGVYTGPDNRGLEIAVGNLSIIGSGGSGETILDCEHAEHGILVVDYNGQVEISGLTIENALLGLSIGCRSTASLTDVQVRYSRYSGVYVDGGTLTAQHLTLYGCGQDIERGGGVKLWFRDMPGSGISPASASLQNCTIVNCNALDSGSAIYSIGQSNNLDILSCSIACNGPAEAIYNLDESGNISSVNNSLFYGNTGGNVGGHLSDPVGSNGNFSADPQFCGVSGSGNVYLQADSPCLPENNDAGVLIGALGLGCDETSILLADFSAEWLTGFVELTWRLALTEPVLDFNLIAERDGQSWSPAWSTTDSGNFIARDESPLLKGGGVVCYRLLSRVPSEDWQLLGALSVDSPAVPRTRLLDSYPNPCNPTTEITFELSNPSVTNLIIYNVAGQRVAALVENTRFEAGRHTLTWDGRRDDGRRLGSGVYFIRFSAGRHVARSKLVLLK